VFRVRLETEEKHDEEPNKENSRMELDTRNFPRLRSFILI
jgi:hypothetical protein